jgi:hypothetical protein
VSDWQRCRPYIEAALTTCPTHGIEDVEAGCAAGLYQFWPGKACATITEVCQYPRMRLLHHWLCGGDLKELLRQVDDIETWARLHDCAGIFGSSARPVLGRVLKAKGYERGQIEWTKEFR